MHKENNFIWSPALMWSDLYDNINQTAEQKMKPATQLSLIE